MAFDEGLAQRVREQLEARTDMEEKKMFGGVGFLLSGNIACGVHKEKLIVRVGPDSYEDALGEKHAGVFDITGRPMKGWITVEPKGYESDDDLVAWVEKGVTFASTLPAK